MNQDLQIRPPTYGIWRFVIFAHLQKVEDEQDLYMTKVTNDLAHTVFGNA